MRKLLFLVLGVIVTFASCRKDDLLGEGNGKEVTVSLTAQLPTASNELSRAAAPGDDSNVNRYIMEVYTGGKLYQRTIQAAAKFELRLVTDQTYDFLFWADHGTGTSNDKDNHYVTEPLTEVTLIGDYKGNDDTRDAFCGKLLSQVVTSAYTPATVVLKRPFGQLNVETKDLDGIGLDKLKPDEVFVVFNTKLYTKFNVLDGSVSEEEPIQYVANADVVDEAGKLSMDYILAPETEKFLVDFTMKFFNNAEEITTNDNFKSVPIQRNYQTNVSGNLLTKQGTITVEVKPAFEVSAITHEIQEVPNVAALNSVLSNLSSGSIEPVAIAVTEKVAADAEVAVPAMIGEKTSVISMSFPAGIATENTLTVSDKGSNEGGMYTGEVHISIPVADAGNLVIDMPNATVYLNGQKVKSVTAKTGENTFVVGKGTVIETLTVEKGNVNVYGEVKSIVKATGNNENTIVNVFPGGVVGSVGAGITVKTIVPGIKNITTGKSYATVQDAVADAKANQTIELSEGRYPIYLQSPVGNALPYYLLIGNVVDSLTNGSRNHEGLTIVGVGNVTLYTEDEATTGNPGQQDFIMVTADKVTLRNLKIVTNYSQFAGGPNKTVEVYEAANEFTMDGCEIIPNNKVSTDGGSVWIGSYQTPDIKGITATIKNCKFNYAGISVRYNATVDIVNNTFNHIRPVDGWKTCISVRGKANVKGNTFKVDIETPNTINTQGEGVITMVNNIFPTTGKYWTGFVNTTKGILYAMLEKAIGEAVSGDVIFFHAGEYAQNLTIPAGVTFLGEDTTSTILTGQIILKEGTTLKNFKHVWACPASPRTAIEVQGNNATMDGVRLMGKMKKEGTNKNNTEALVTNAGVTNFNVKNCAFLGYWKGMYLNETAGLVMKNNEFTYNPFSTDKFDPSMVVEGNKFPVVLYPTYPSMSAQLCHLVVDTKYASSTDRAQWSTELKTFINNFFDNNTWAGAKSIRIQYKVNEEVKNDYVTDKIIDPVPAPPAE